MHEYTTVAWRAAERELNWFLDLPLNVDICSWKEKLLAKLIRHLIRAHIISAIWQRRNRMADGK